MRISIIFLIATFFGVSCERNKGIENKNLDLKIQNLKKIASLIKRNESDATYDFLHEKLTIPSNFDTIPWKNLKGQIVFTSDTLGYKLFTFFDIVEDVMENYTVNIEDLNMYLGKPTKIATEGDSIVSYFYLFNNRSYPKCSNLEANPHLHYQNCSFIGMSFDSAKNVALVYNSGFQP